MKTLSVMIGLTLLFGAVPTHVFAQTEPLFAEGCVSQINSRLGTEQRLYRRTLFGLLHAEEAPVNSVRYDQDGNAWLKTDDDEWRMTGNSSTKDDDAMDRATERDALDPSDENTFRTGIFGTKALMTSDLLPPIIQSYRALECRAASVCEAAKLAFGGDDSESVQINSAGCRTLPMRGMNQCIPPDSNEDGTTIPDSSAVLTYCESVATQMMVREAALLKLSVSYDAAYRTLLQFSGNFDNFLAIFRIDLLEPIRDSQQLLWQLSRIPCFVSQCNE